jgi:hypothetical protein
MVPLPARADAHARGTLAWSGHDSVLIGAALVLVAVTLAKALNGRPRPHTGPIPPPRWAS